MTPAENRPAVQPGDEPILADAVEAVFPRPSRQSIGDLSLEPRLSRGNLCRVQRPASCFAITGKREAGSIRIARPAPPDLDMDGLGSTERTNRRWVRRRLPALFQGEVGNLVKAR